MLIEVLLQVDIALHGCYVLFEIYKLVFVFPREKRITLMAFCYRDDERTLTTSC